MSPADALDTRAASLAPAARDGSGAAARRALALRVPGRKVVIGIPYLWVLLFFMAPFLIVLKISVSEMDGVRFKDVLTFTDGLLRLTLKLSNYAFVTQDDLYFKTYLSSVKYAAVTTVLCLAIGYPFAYFMARAKVALQPTLLMLVMLPFWTSFLLRVYAWKGLLSEGGLAAGLLSTLGVDHALVAAGLIPALGKFMNSPFSLVLGMVYTYLPFMILPLYGNLAKLDLRLLEAAADLGATPFVAFPTRSSASQPFLPFHYSRPSPYRLY